MHKDPTKLLVAIYNAQETLIRSLEGFDYKLFETKEKANAVLDEAEKELEIFAINWKTMRPKF